MVRIGGSVSGGDESVNIQGDHNHVRKYVTNIGDGFGIPRNYLYDVCKELIKADIQPSNDYSLKVNAEWTQKLNFNKVSKEYAEMLSEDAHAYKQLEEVMSTFPNRELIVRKLHFLYLKVEKQRIRNTQDNDYVLQNVYDETYEILNQHENSLKEKMPDEVREQCVWLLMFYAFTKCKLLKTPAEAI